MSGTFGAPQVQALISMGYGIAAGILGKTYVAYRPQTTGPVLTQNNIVQELPLAFDQDYKFSFLKPQEYNKPVYYALMDLTYINVGDYLWDYNQLTFFVAWIEPLRPAELVMCNRTISLYRPSGSLTNGYGGDTDPATILTSWPVAMVPGSKGEANEAKTPGAIRAPWWIIYMPAITGVSVEEYDLMIDDLGRRMIVSSNSLAREGWYITADEEQS